MILLVLLLLFDAEDEPRGCSGLVAVARTDTAAKESSSLASFLFINNDVVVVEEWDVDFADPGVTPC